ncbi:IS701 family transposase [Dehalococcoidia bacterium]|nr:IS701 family transposase [Dehalococcoidia bacterium]
MLILRVIDPGDDGQNFQQFMSDSPWSAGAVFQAEVRQRPELRGGMLTLDESGDKKAGNQSAGVARQYLGRLGKVDLGQMGVALGYYQAAVWMMVDAELYLPEEWFDQAHADLRRRLHIPPDRTFSPKSQLGLEMILRAKSNGLPFHVVGCFYGRDSHFRAALDKEGLLYLVEVPSDTHVYLERPRMGVPEKPLGHRGRPFSRQQVLSGVLPVGVRQLRAYPDLEWRRVKVRPVERGALTYECTAMRVWTLTDDGRVRQEWLFIHREKDGDCSYFLSNAPADTPLETLALWRSLRYFVERIFQDGKSEIGWDELVAQKYRAWMHHTALTALALWFIAETKLDWAREYGRDPELARQLEVEILPNLSVANVRELLRAALPLNQFSLEEATGLVVKHLFHRACSTRSRLKAQYRAHEPV